MANIYRIHVALIAAVAWGTCAAALPSPSAAGQARAPVAFTESAWDTHDGSPLIGDPRAVKGGSIRLHIPDFPATLRIWGPESNTQLNDTIRPLVWETLLRLHSTTGAWMPALATHWQVSPDRRTFRFRLDPNARFSDGRPVTADDVVATWRLLVDKGLADPAAQLAYGRFQPPVAESRDVVRVTTGQASWRDFYQFAGAMFILPAPALANVDGARYVTDYNFRMLPGTGPYRLDEADIEKGQRLTLRRRADYWAVAYRRNVGLNNFDRIQISVVRDPNLAIELFKRGDLDYLVVNSSRQWVQALDVDQVRRGLIQRRRVFTDAPVGVQGLAFNTRRAPWSDPRVRRALAHLLNRELLIAKLFFGEYLPQNSYFAGGPYENRRNPKTPYDPRLAVSLLTEAGWNARDAQGRLVKDGRPLVVEVLYAQQTSEPYLTIYQEDLRKAGITLNLRLVTPETLFRLVMDRQFDLVNIAWSADPFPVPEPMFHSRLADSRDTNNITGFKHARVDALIAAYDAEFDQAKRAATIRELDGIAAAEYHYILQWNMPFRRIAYWNRFGYPASYLTRNGSASDIVSLWWHDADAARRLDAAIRQGATLPLGPLDVRPSP
ncbi:MAG: ABC transporter substrate-binding protein [Acidobacteria bacterium]|nr:ABC transporter substrate-binding protein [Acidobacteriota bacterium]